MWRLIVVSLLAGLSLGCRGSSGTESSAPGGAQQPAGAPLPALGGWVMDVKQMRVPEAPASGTLHGRAFRPDKAQCTDGILTLRQGQGFFADLEIKVFLFATKGETLEGKDFEATGSNDFGNPHVHVSWTENNFPSSEVFMDKYALKLHFDKAKDGRLPGTIYLCLPDASRSYVAGTFVAEGTGQEASSKKLGPADAPYIQGKITLKGVEKGMLTAGYIGNNLKGDAQANSAGTSFVPGGGGWVQCTTFAPRLTSLRIDPQGFATFQHAKVEPGRYLAFVHLEERCVDWRWVDVATGAQLTIDFTAEPANAGRVEVTLPGTLAQEIVRLIPLDAEGKLPELKISPSQIASTLKTEAKAKEGKAVFEGLRAGSYRVLAGDARADVQVRPGAAVKVDLAADK